MQVGHRTDNDINILSIEGNIEIEAVNELKAFVNPMLEDASLQGLLINMEKVKVIDSSGIGWIISAFKALQARQAPFALCQVNPGHLKIFTMTRLDKILSIYDTEEEALNQMK